MRLLSSFARKNVKLNKNCIACTLIQNMENQKAENEIVDDLEQTQEDKSETLNGLEFLEEQRLETVRDFEAMLAPDEDKDIEIPGEK